MPALAAPGSARRTRGLRGLSQDVRWVMVFSAVSLLSVAAELVYLGVPYYVGPDAWRGADLTGQILWSLGVPAWNALVPVALVALLAFAAKRLPRGMPAAAVTCVLDSAAVIAAMILLTVDNNSTGVLLLLFLRSNFSSRWSRGPKRMTRFSPARLALGTRRPLAPRKAAAPPTC